MSRILYSASLTSELRRLDASSHGLTEIWLRVGLIQLPLPYLGTQRRPEIFQISMSEEMAPWRLNNSYDRPILRRIAEERGVPRAFFGQTKMATVVIFPKPVRPRHPPLRAAFLA